MTKSSKLGSVDNVPSHHSILFDGMSTKIVTVLHEGVTQFDLPGGLHACQFCCMRMLSQVKSHPAPGIQVSGILQRFSAWVQRHADNLTKQGVKDAQRFVSEVGKLKELPTLAAVLSQLGWHRSFRITWQTGGAITDDCIVPPDLSHFFHTGHSYWVILFGTYATCVFRVDTGFAWYDSHQGLVLWFPSADLFLAVALRHYSQCRLWYLYTLEAMPDPCSAGVCTGARTDGPSSDARGTGRTDWAIDIVPNGYTALVPHKPLRRLERGGVGVSGYSQCSWQSTVSPEHGFSRLLSERSLARCERIRSQHNNSRG